MATTNPFLNVRAKAGGQDKSLSWYQTQVRALARLSPNKLLANTPDLTTRIMPGAMYMFFYDAKHQDKLPYWDQFPLVLPFRRVSDGFYGINLHYIPYGARFKLLGYLHDLATDEKITEETRVRVSWQFLDGSSKFEAVKPCVKRYLYSQLKSKFLNIKYPDWITAAMLPVEQFIGASKSEVWRESRKMY